MKSGQKQNNWRTKISLIFSFLIPLNSVSASGLFVDLSYVGTSISIADQEFQPALTQLGLGWQFTERFSVEVLQATSDSDDQVLTVTSEVESMSTVLLRYGSPVNSDVNAYVIAGYTELNLLMNGASLQTNENYSGNSWGFGFEERLSNDGGLRLRFDYINHYRQGELTVNSYQLGLRYVFD